MSAHRLVGLIGVVVCLSCASVAGGNGLVSASLGAATCNANVSVELIAPGTDYENRLQQVDLRFTRAFRIGRFRVRANR